MKKIAKKKAARITIWEELNKLRKRLAGAVEGKLISELDPKSEAKRVKNELADELQEKDPKKK